MTSNFLKTLANFVKSRRKQMKMSQKKLALLAYGDENMQSKISAIENNKVEGINTNTVDKLLEVLNAKTVFLKGEERNIEDINQTVYKEKKERINKNTITKKVKVSKSEYCLCEEPFFIPGGPCMDCGKPIK